MCPAKIMHPATTARKSIIEESSRWMNHGQTINPIVITKEQP